MLQKFRQHIDINFPFLHGKKLLIAISGGVDSVVLTHLVNTLEKTHISLAHCNFKLREEESDLDEQFVIQLGNQLHLKTFTTQFDTEKIATKQKLSIQLAARKLRYNWFDELVKKHSFDHILTAHHADDNLETFLINFTRGTGLEGLTGIPTVNKNIIRPLLTFSREEIIHYAKENSILWREDTSNTSTKYLRNKIRHTIIPVLKELNPSLLTSFDNTLKNLKETNQIVKDYIKDISKKTLFFEQGIIKINIQEISALSNPKAYLYQLLKAYNFTEWNDVYNLITAQTGKKVYSKTHVLLKDRYFLLLLYKNELGFDNQFFKIEENTSNIKKPIHFSLKKVEQKGISSKKVIYVDKNSLNFPLIIRRWKNGDYFYPLGMIGKKKVSKYFKDEKLSLVEKENTWLLCNSDSEIVWIIGKRQDRRFLASEQTTNILKINI